MSLHVLSMNAMNEEICLPPSSFFLAVPDGGWINHLLHEAENERMHLLTWEKLIKPNVAERLLVLGAQGGGLALILACSQAPSLTSSIARFTQSSGTPISSSTSSSLASPIDSSAILKKKP